MKYDPSRIRKRIVSILSILGFILGLGAWGIWLQDGYTKPQSPDPTVGRVYRLNSHGAIVYLTRQEQFVIYGLQALAVLTFGGAVIIDATTRRTRAPR